MSQKQKVLSAIVRRIIIEQSYRAHIGHIGCCLSIADILAALYDDVLVMKNPTDPQRDYFILSKGHAALALYATLYLKGWITKKELESFHTDGSLLGVHPELGVPGIELATGSLGQGLSVGVGLALGCKIRKTLQHIYVLVSDAECNEGSVWEAAMFASHHQLDNLTVIVDKNGQQGFGYTNDVLSLEPFGKKWISFGWELKEVDGHNTIEIKKSLLHRSKEKRPLVIIAQTILGKGIPYMEKKIDWHYLPMTENEYKIALQTFGKKSK